VIKGLDPCSAPVSCANTENPQSDAWKTGATDLRMACKFNTYTVVRNDDGKKIAVSAINAPTKLCKLVSV